jgi:hypothetical protein
MYQNVIKEALTSITNITGAMSSDVTDVTRCQEVAYQLNVSNSVSLSGATVKIQKSLDQSLWHDDTSATNITTNGEYFLSASQPLDGNFYKLKFAITSGHFDAAMNILGKGLV